MSKQFWLSLSYSAEPFFSSASSSTKILIFAHCQFNQSSFDTLQSFSHCWWIKLPWIYREGTVDQCQIRKCTRKTDLSRKCPARRCVIPAKGFYEWNVKKVKYQFERLDQEAVLFMAGCFQRFQEQEWFVILTTQANASVSPVHHRMPLVLEKNEIEN